MARRPLLLLAVAAATLLLAAPQAEAQFGGFRVPDQIRNPLPGPVTPVQPSKPLTGNYCGCTQTYRNPVTGQSISCTCYFNNQNGAYSCPGAQYGQASRRYYREC
jgi:hypothetical protein